jgi:hypothetical protein
MGAAVVRSDDLNVLPPPTAVRVFVLDADVREVDLIIEVGQVVFVSPLANLVGCPIGVAVVIVVVLVALVQPPLVLALELVVETTRSMWAPRSARRACACSYAR